MADAAGGGGAGDASEAYLANYRLARTLGIGSFGKVKVAEHIITGQKVRARMREGAAEIFSSSRPRRRMADVCAAAVCACAVRGGGQSSVRVQTPPSAARR